MVEMQGKIGSSRKSVGIKQENVFSNVLTVMTTVDVICYKYKSLKTGELPLKIKVCKDRKTRYINFGISIKAEHRGFEKSQPKSPALKKECACDSA